MLNSPKVAGSGIGLKARSPTSPTPVDPILVAVPVVLSV